MNLAVPDYLLNVSTKKEDISSETGQSESRSIGTSVTPTLNVASKRKNVPIMFQTPPKRTKVVGSSLKGPYAASMPSTSAALLSSSGIGRGAPAKAMGAPSAKSSLPFTTSGSTQYSRPVPAPSNDCMKSLTPSKKDKMMELDGYLECRFTTSAKDNILGSLSACGLTVDEKSINNPTLIPNDSFFRNMIQYFPQFKCLDPNIAATNICQLLCEYVGQEGTNFSKVGI